MLAEVIPFGHERTVEAGDVLYQAGDAAAPFVVVLEGEVEIARTDERGDDIVTARGANGFLGELNLITGQRPYLTARATMPGRVLVVEPDDFRRLMSTKPEISDLVFRAFVARRELLRTGDAKAAIQI